MGGPAVDRDDADAADPEAAGEPSGVRRGRPAPIGDLCLAAST